MTSPHLSNSSEPRFSEAADLALAKFYSGFGSQQTDEQKINILQKELGESQFYSTGGDVPIAAKLACLEYEWLVFKHPETVEVELA